MKKLDALQRRFKVTSFGYAVQKKFGDDRGGYLAALVTYYGFISIFPLLLAAFTVVAYALSGDPHAIKTLEDRVGTYPIVGPAATELGGKKLQGSAVALVVGVVGLVWGAMGLAQVLQHTMNEAWNIPAKDRPGTARILTRGLGWYCAFGLGIVVSTSVASLGSAFSWPGGTVVSSLAALVINLALFTASFWILSPRRVAFRRLLPGAVFAGAAWTVLTGVGIGLTHHLAHSNALYGTFAPVLGLLALLYLAARISIYAVEANVVAAEHLWPRSLSGKDLTPADRGQLERLVLREQRLEEERVGVTF